MFRTLSGRLTFLYTLLFAILSLVVFKTIDYNLETNLLERIDSGFLDDGRECVQIYQEGGLTALTREISLETESTGDDKLFLRVYSPEFDLLFSSDTSKWIGLPDHSETLEKKRNEPFTTIALPESARRVRMFFQDLGDGSLLQFGKVLSEDEQLLKNFREVFYLSFTVMLFSGITIGLFLARHALSGVRKVQHGADQMSKGDLSQRIAMNGGSEEIRNLTLSFNRMQDRIQTLISELHDVTNNVAHDLRSPVTRMRGLAETTLTGNQSLDDYRDLAGAVVEESDRLVSMINTMLEIAETDAGLRPLANESVDMKEIALDVVELYSSVAQDKKIILSANITEPQLVLSGDRSSLQRDLGNLLDNAIKFTQQGGRVTLSDQSDGQKVTVRIADNGPGIPERDLTYIFDRFFRGDQSRSTPGSGLGLSLAQSIVLAHGGSLSVSSEAGQGTKVEVSLPI